MTNRTKFPLPKGFFGHIDLSINDKDKYCSAVHDCVSTALQEEEEFGSVYLRQVNMDIWQIVKQKRHYHIYRRQKSVINQSNMLGIGRAEGSLEDILYGWHNKTHEGIKISTAMLSTTLVDATVLHTIETATLEDPFHYIGLKWMLTKVPMVRPCDWCFIAAMGITKDKHGRRYGYLVQKSVEVANCPPFHRNGIIRGQTTVAFILRERLTDNAVDVFSTGSFNAAGDMMEQASVVATIDIFCSVFQSAKCAEAKKLTVLATQNANDLTRQHLLDNGEHCYMCHKKNRLFSPLRTCKICNAQVCSACYVKKWTFMGLNYIGKKVVCCLTCIQVAKNMKVRPAEPEFSIPENQRMQPKKEVEHQTLNVKQEKIGHRGIPLEQTYWLSSRSYVVLGTSTDDVSEKIASSLASQSSSYYESEDDQIVLSSERHLVPTEGLEDWGNRTTSSFVSLNNSQDGEIDETSEVVYAVELGQVLEPSQALRYPMGQFELSSSNSWYVRSNPKVRHNNDPLYVRMQDLHDRAKRISAITQENHRIMKKVC